MGRGWVRHPIGPPVALAMWLAATGVAGSAPYVYPGRGQSAEQQKRDRYECHAWAVQQSGFDPSVAKPPAPAAQSSGGPSALRGAAGGAAVGAVGGAIAGDAGTGAAVGAATGALFGGMRKHQKQQAQQQAQGQQQAAYAQAQAGYDRAVGACLTARGYTVG